MIALNTRPLIQRKTNTVQKVRRRFDGSRIVNVLVIGKGALKGERCDKAHETLLIRHRL